MGLVSSTLWGGSRGPISSIHLVVLFLQIIPVWSLNHSDITPSLIARKKKEINSMHACKPNYTYIHKHLYVCALIIWNDTWLRSADPKTTRAAMRSESACDRSTQSCYSKTRRVKSTRFNLSLTKIFGSERLRRASKIIWNCSAVRSISDLKQYLPPKIIFVDFICLYSNR